MNNVERSLFSCIIFIGGVALGMYYEHQRFVREVQDLSGKHAAAKNPPPPPPVQPDPPTPQPEAAA